MIVVENGTSSFSLLTIPTTSWFSVNLSLAIPSKHFLRCGCTLSGSLVSDNISNSSSLDKKKNLETQIKRVHYCACRVKSCNETPLCKGHINRIQITMCSADGIITIYFRHTLHIFFATYMYKFFKVDKTLHFKGVHFGADSNVLYVTCCTCRSKPYLHSI